ncbi:assimilatory sulfite reductase [Lactarius vividus]|nr:assimilatory sulfite reductase [Lactarius vividus]
MATDDSGVETPISSSSTLASKSPILEKQQPIQPYSSTASNLIEFISSRSATSSTLFVYDLAEQAGFGLLSKEWSKSDQGATSVIPLQTRSGAGLSLVGRLSQGTSKDAVSGSVLTVYNTPTGLVEMVPSLAYAPSPTANSRLILQVPTVSVIGDRLTLSPTLASLNTVLPVIPESFVVLLSATPQESVDIAALAYKFPAHVIHLFNHHGSSREVGQLQVPSISSKEVGSTVRSVLQQSGYHSFDYMGDRNAQTVIVVLNGPLALALKATLANTPLVGVLVVRVLRPWDEELFQDILPPTVKHIHIIEDAPFEAPRGLLHANVRGSVLDFPGPIPDIHHQPVTPVRLSDLLGKPRSLTQFLSNLPSFPADVKSHDMTTAAKLIFFSTPGTPLSSVPQRIEQTFAQSPRVSARLLTEHDVLSRPGAIAADRIWLEPRNDSVPHTPLSVGLPISSDSAGVCNFLAIFDQSLLKSHSLLKHAKFGASILVVTSWSASELVSGLAEEDISLIRDRELHLYMINANLVASQLGPGGVTQNSLQGLIVHLAFLRLYLGPRASEAAILKLTENLYGTSVDGVSIPTVIARVWDGLAEVDLSSTAAEPGDKLERKDFEFNAIVATAEDGNIVVNGARLGSWHDAARHLLFPYAFIEQDIRGPSTEQYPQIPALHPESPDRTYLVTCTVNRRLTPREYDRNVFHVEFDTTGTGLKYAIGEALAVHGWNDEAEVLDFCDWYGVDPARLITIPVPGDDTKVHTRTVFQALQQQIDLFGKPPKSFYSDLAEYAKNSVDRHTLLFIGSPEGISTFKKLSEKDTVTFADVLRRHPSARPGIEVLCGLIGDIKPRHYSIASAQSAVGDRVDLLVVTVDWVTPSGTPRYGQCTRYLAELKIGQKVTVSIKPSVMKLPAENTQPLIMAGLGTGAAPFRAFLQHRALLATQGVPLGPVYYYFGSRHQSQEYLYGEEIEAFIQDGIITKAGLAFSRDGPKKVYIQHKMLDDVEALVRMLHEEQGVFYLCGPTWPVPDVYETLVKAFETHCGMDATVADAFLERLKGEERYVLEVY